MGWEYISRTSMERQIRRCRTVCSLFGDGIKECVIIERSSFASLIARVFPISSLPFPGTDE